MVSLRQINQDPDRYRVVTSEIENVEHLISEVASRQRGNEREAENLEFRINKLGEAADDDGNRHRLAALPRQIARDRAILASYERELAALRAPRAQVPA